MKLKKLLCCTSLLIFYGGVGANESEGDLCRSDEIRVASCSMDEKKNRILSFCASHDRKVIFYRFGTKPVIELMKSFSGENPVFRWVDAATYTTYFGFRSSGYAYVFGVPQETLGAKAFLEVTNLDGFVMDRTCTDNSFGDKSIVSGAVRDVEDSVVRGNGFLFPPNNNMLDESPSLKRE